MSTTKRIGKVLHYWTDDAGSWQLVICRRLSVNRSKGWSLQILLWLRDDDPHGD